MSAFIPMPEHIGLLAACIANSMPESGTPATVAEAMAREVIASVAYRYPYDTGNGDRPGPCLTDEQIVQASVLYAEHYAPGPGTENFPNVNARDISNMAKCYEYQACEHPGWQVSAVRSLLIALGSITAQEILRVGNKFAEHVRWEFMEEENPLPEVEAWYPQSEEAA